MSSAGDCPICGSLPDLCSAFIKGGEVIERLPRAVELLEPTYIDDHRVAGRSSYEKTCPACGAIFQFVTDYEYLTGGTEDTVEVRRTGRRAEARPSSAPNAPDAPNPVEAVQEQLRGLVTARAVAMHRKNYGFTTDREIAELDAKIAALPSRELLEPVTVALENPWQHDAWQEEVVIPAGVVSVAMDATPEASLDVPVGDSVRCPRCGSTSSTITAMAYEIESHTCDRCGFEWARSMFDPTD